MWRPNTKKKKQSPVIRLGLRNPRKKERKSVRASKFKVHCGSVFEPGASGLPYYCTPPGCVPDVIGALAVWRQNNQKRKNRSWSSVYNLVFMAFPKLSQIQSINLLYSVQRVQGTPMSRRFPDKRGGGALCITLCEAPY